MEARTATVPGATGLVGHSCSPGCKGNDRSIEIKENWISCYTPQGYDVNSIRARVKIIMIPASF